MKNNIVVKIISLLLISAMVFSGCAKKSGDQSVTTNDTGVSSDTQSESENKDLDPYTIDWYFVGSGPQPDTEAVEEKINELLKDINTKVKIHIYSWGDYSDKIQTELLAGEKIDLFFTCSWAADYYTLVRKQILLDITDMLPEYAPHAVEVLKGGFIEGSQVSGRNYAVPSNKEKGAQLGLMYNKTIADKYGFDMSTMKEQKDLIPLFEVLKEKEPEIYPYDNSEGYATACMTLMDDKQFGATISFDSEKDAYIPIYENTKWLESINQSREIFLGGYCNPDVAVAKNSDALRKAGQVFCWFDQTLPAKAADLSITYKNEMGVTEIGDPFIRTFDMIGAMMGIPKTCENPERVLMFLDRLYYDKDLLNTIDFGLEGKHYVKTGDNVIDFAPETDGGKILGYSIPPFEIGDTFQSYLFTTQDPNKWANYQKFNESAMPLKNLGFVIDQEPIKNEITSLLSVSVQYSGAIMSGSVDPSSSIKEFKKKLQDVGVDKVVEEVNKQYEEWKVTK